MITETTIKEHVFRIKKMNAIETLAIQSQISFDSVEDTTHCYNQILERLEVKCNNDWLPVKEKDKNIFYPANVEDDLQMIQDLIKFFMSWLKDVFQKSNESNSKTE